MTRELDAGSPDKASGVEGGSEASAAAEGAPGAPSGDDPERSESRAPDEKARGAGAAGDRADAPSVLAQLGLDLSELIASQPTLADPRLWERELTCVKEVLQRRVGHAAVLIGPDGVGKRALVASLARDITEGHVPPRLLGRHVIELPFHRVLASVHEDGDFERIVFLALREAGMRDDVILFLSQITSFMGLLSRQRGFFNAAYAIEMGCHQPGLYLLGSATAELYGDALHNLPWCERLLTPVEVVEPTRDETLDILRDRAEDLGGYHGISIEDAAIEAAVDLSNLHVRERVLPGKALELLDRAASKLATGIATGAASGPLGVEQVIEALSDWIDVPPSKLSTTGRSELLNLEERLSSRIKGQDHCIRKIADTIRVGMLGLDARPVRPNGVFLFVGPSGVGKSELTIALAEELYGSETYLFEFNMARYSDDDGLARLIGLSLGDVDYPGDLSSAVLRHPHSVVVFEHIERSHKDVAVMLMQIFRNGYVMSGHGEKVFFSNSIVILTSNAENILPQMKEEGAVGFGQIDRDEGERFLQEAKDAIEEFFPAEFMDGIDEVLLFDPLSEGAMKDIVQIHLGDIRTRLADRSIALHVTDGAIAVLAEKGHSREYGARNLGRTVEAMVLKPLARFLISNGNVREVTVRVVEGDIEIAEGRGPNAKRAAEEGATS
jgi:ATP-dependent Clp protease ATP-binding subunit ClpC